MFLGREARLGPLLCLLFILVLFSVHIITMVAADADAPADDCGSGGGVARSTGTAPTAGEGKWCNLDVVTFDDDGSARLVAYLHAWHQYVDGSPDGYLWGQYHTKLRRTGSGWKFTELVLKIAGMIDFHRDHMHPIGRRPV